MLGECWDGHVPTLPYNHTSLPALAEWMHVPLQHLEGIAYGRPDGGYQLLGHMVHHEHVSTDYRAVCPACLGANAVTTVQAMLDGTIRACAMARGKRGFAALRFDGADVSGWQAVLSASERQTLSVDQAAHLLQVKQQALYGWVRQSLLATLQVDGRRAEQGRRITAEAIEEFQQQYITAGEIRLDGRLGQSKKLALMLIQQGLVPVSGPSVDGCRQFLFRRLDVEEFITRNHPTTTA